MSTYRFHAYGRLWPDTPVMDSVVGTESEAQIAALAQQNTDTIYFDSQEGTA